MKNVEKKTPQSLNIPVERDLFLRNLIRELAGTLQNVVGMEETAGFISIVGQRIGNQLDEIYKKELSLEALDREQVAEVLVDLKRRIKGDFYIIEENEEKIVLGNKACPFGDKVIGRPALCMMTSNVFGVITAENLGYGKVVLDKSIAKGDIGCRVTIHLRPSDESQKDKGREYFKN